MRKKDRIVVRLPNGDEASVYPEAASILSAIVEANGEIVTKRQLKERLKGAGLDSRDVALIRSLDQLRHHGVPFEVVEGVQLRPMFLKSMADAAQ